LGNETAEEDKTTEEDETADEDGPGESSEPVAATPDTETSSSTEQADSEGDGSEDGTATDQSVSTESSGATPETTNGSSEASKQAELPSGELEDGTVNVIMNLDKEEYDSLRQFLQVEDDDTDEFAARLRQYLRNVNPTLSMSK
jgi:hypothetical protein